MSAGTIESSIFKRQNKKLELETLLGKQKKALKKKQEDLEITQVEDRGADSDNENDMITSTSIFIDKNLSLSHMTGKDLTELVYPKISEDASFLPSLENMHHVTTESDKSESVIINAVVDDLGASHVQVIDILLSI